MSLVLRLSRDMHLCRSSGNVPRMPLFLEMQGAESLLARYGIPCACHAKTTSEPSKVVRTPSALYIFTSKCASRHNGVHFFDIWTSKSGPSMMCFVHFDFEMCFPPQRRALFSKSGPSMVCFVHFDFEMCFAPQQRALFRRLNFQSWSEREVFNFHLQMCFAPQRHALFQHLHFEKSSETVSF